MRKDVVIVIVSTACCLALAAFAVSLAELAGKPVRPKPEVPADGSPESKALERRLTGPSAATALKVKALRAEQLKYRGTTIGTTPDAAGEELALQQEIAAAFAEQDPVPAERRKYFDWCFKVPRLIHCGWHGAMTKVGKSPRGWLVEVNVSPRLADQDSASTFTYDNCQETWEYSGGKLTYLKGGVAGPGANRLVIYD